MPSLTDAERSIGFLIADASRLLRRDFDRRVRELGLTQVQWRAIARLSREEGLKQTELAERLEVTPIAVARLIDRLELAHWVQRRPDPGDRRVSRLYLTDKSQPILVQMREHAAAALEDALQGVSAASRRQLVSTLTRLKQNLSAGEADSKPGSSGRTKKNVRRQ
jgi:MarR family transcriptional regulator for hemolysin